MCDRSGGKARNRPDGAIAHGFARLARSHEEHNLYRAADPLVDSLCLRLERWSRRSVPLFNSARPPDAKTIKALESLGYARKGAAVDRRFSL